MNIFRPEALRSQDRLHGDINLVPPVSWRAVTILLAFILVAALVFLAASTYGKVSTARGVLEGDRGTADLVTRLPGAVGRVAVREGQRVRRGQLVMTIDHATVAGAGTLEARRRSAIEQERATVLQQEGSLRAAAAARISANASLEAAARSTLDGYEARIAEQRRLVEAARTDLDKAKEVAVRGFLSQQDLRRREERLAQSRQELSSLLQQRANSLSDLERARADSARERADLARSMSDVRARSAAVDARMADDGAVSRTDVLAPTDGIVAALPRLAGETVAAGERVAVIAPSGAGLRARLTLPDDAVPMVAPGQTARLSVDAFPFQTYGTVEARIVRVSEQAVDTDEGKRFVAFAEMKADGVDAYGRRRALRPGMRLTARIRTMERTLLQWLLDPIYAVSTR